VPEIDAVGALPDPAQWLAAQQTLAQARVRVGRGRDHDGRGERHGCQAAAVQERIELAEAEAKEDEGGESGEAREVEEQRSRPAPPAPQPSPVLDTRKSRAVGKIPSSHQTLPRNPREG
jgi:hypothetical protein